MVAAAASAVAAVEGGVEAVSVMVGWVSVGLFDLAASCTSRQAYPRYPFMQQGLCQVAVGEEAGDCNKNECLMQQGLVICL